MERHRQIAFADRVLLNKVDLVTDEEAVEVWHRIRSYNDSAKIVASVKGVVPASDLTGLSAFDPDSIAFEQEELGGHESGHGGAHSHGGHEDCYEDHGHGGHEGHGGGHGDGHGAGHVAGHGHGLSQRHDEEIGSFSIVRRGVEVEPLAFARWVRVLATLPEDKGRVYRSKGVLAAMGKQSKLIFHAVADVTETSDGPCWRENEPRLCKIVFIGKKLARKEIEERFLQLLQPVGKRIRPALAAPVMPERKTLLGLAQGGMLHHALLGCWSKDVIRVSQACAGLRDAIFSPNGHTFFQAAASTLPEGAPRGLQTVEGALWLHSLLPLTSIKAYAQAWRGARIKLNTACTVADMWGEPLRFDDGADAEAAGVMWQEVCELSKGSDDATCNFLIEFKWRPETMKSFFDVAGSGTNSTLVKITVEDPSDSELDDDLRFRVNLNPEQSEDAAAMSLHRLSLQLVGGKTSNHVYQILMCIPSADNNGPGKPLVATRRGGVFFHTVDPAYQVHINVPDHRTPIFPTKEVFHQWHPLMAGLKRRPRLRFLLRLKSMESGPLDAMCGCCG
ncbi:unnamed protein product [Prorocentrum cordatum]|uniref:CobW C-terminal domain-containing protein n=1 Tax=Prorocentrum cordatum TaxID=2364126 RepID=A0ABN9YCC8_9DINO|nr:unnamed protein product [Polarella glacialis]